MKSRSPGGGFRRAATAIARTAFDIRSGKKLKTPTVKSAIKTLKKLRPKKTGGKKWADLNHNVA